MRSLGRKGFWRGVSGLDLGWVGLGGLRLASGSPRGQNEHTGGGHVEGDLSSPDGRISHQSLWSRSERAASEGGVSFPA